MTEAEEIARKLTKAQRECILALSDTPQRAGAATFRSSIARTLAWATGRRPPLVIEHRATWPSLWSLNDPGLAVRAALTKEQNHD